MDEIRGVEQSYSIKVIFILSIKNPNNGFVIPPYAYVIKNIKVTSNIYMKVSGKFPEFEVWPDK